MEPSRINRKFLSAVLSVVCLTLGCGQGDQVDGTSSSSSGGGHDGGPVMFPCMWGKPDAGLTFPVCTEPQTSEFIGTIDGKPYDLKTKGAITAMAPPAHPPYSLSMALSGGGSLDLLWGDPYIRGTWKDVVGDMILPENTSQSRGVYPDSQLLWSCDDYAFLYILHVWGPDSQGELTGCSR